MNKFNSNKPYQKVKVINMLNHDAEITSQMINQWTKQGWTLFEVLVLEKAQKKKHSALCVILVKREVEDV